MVLLSKRLVNQNRGTGFHCLARVERPVGIRRRRGARAAYDTGFCPFPLAKVGQFRNVRSRLCAPAQRAAGRRARPPSDLIVKEPRGY
jgi:hypothetical protein